MQNIRKAAILLQNLDEALVAEMLSQMPRDIAAAVTLELATLEDVTLEQQESVLSEFRSLAQQSQVIDDEPLDVPVDGSQLAQIDDIAETTSDASASTYNPQFAFLHQVSAGSLLRLIGDEHPQTIALVISHLPAPLAADVIGGFPPHTQLDIIRRVTNIEQPDREIIRDVESGLERRMKSTVRPRVRDEQPVLASSL